MANLLSYTFVKLRNAGILPSFNISSDNDDANASIVETVKVNNLKGYICPVFNPETVEELDEDGSALIFFEASSDTVWNEAVRIFERSGYNVLQSKNKQKFGVIVSDSEIDVPTSSYVSKSMSDSGSDSGSDHEERKVEEKKVEEKKVEEKKVEEKKVEERKVEEKKVEEKLFIKPEGQKWADKFRREPEDFRNKFARWNRKELIALLIRLGGPDYTEVKRNKKQMLEEVSNFVSEKVKNGEKLDLHRPKNVRVFRYTRKKNN
jgi:hypothetical protein